MDDMMPMKTMAGVSNLPGTASMNALSRAPIMPVRSATPMPSIPTSTTPSGGNRMKFSTILPTTQNRPSRVSRLVDAKVFPVSRHSTPVEPSSRVTCTGRRWTTVHSPRAAISERTTMNSAPIRKSVVGSGRRFPTRSMTSRNPPERGPAVWGCWRWLLLFMALPWFLRGYWICVAWRSWRFCLPVNPGVLPATGRPGPPPDRNGGM